MEIRTFGKSDAPAVLLLPDQGMDILSLYTPLKALEGSYFLLCAALAPGEDTASAAAALEECLREDFTGRIWGAYGLRQGGSVLLTLLAGGHIRIRTAVVEGVTELPEAGAPRRGRVYFWAAARDRKALKARKALRASYPPLRTLTMKKIKKGQDFVSVRPDLMVKRLSSLFGRAAAVRVSSVLDTDVESLWRKLERCPADRAVLRLTEVEPLERCDEDHTQVVEGRSRHLSLWSHLTRLDSVGESATVYTDQVELSAGLLSAPLRLWTRLHLKKGQRDWQKQLRREKKRKK